MLGRKTLLAVGAVVAGLLLPAPAMAQFEAITDANLNLRVGPGVNYGVIDVIPYGDVVDVFGCLEHVEWCDVEWWGLRGWVSARYLVHLDTTVYLPQVYARIGVPIISFSFSTYHDRYYRDRPWYKKRDGRWRGRDWRRGDRPKRQQQLQEAERPREQREVEPSRQQRQIERAKQKRQQRLQQQLQEAERPRRQREVEPSRQQRQIERGKQKRQQRLQEAEQPRQGKRTQRPQQVQEAEQPRQGKRSERQGRSGSGGPPEELLDERGQ